MTALPLQQATHQADSLRLTRREQLSAWLVLMAFAKRERSADITPRARKLPR